MPGFGWLSVEMVKPKCARDPEALGVPVLVWPRSEKQLGVAFYGRRATGKPAFYLYGSEVEGVTHWMPMPTGPNVEGKGRCAALYRAASSGGRRPERP